MPRRKFVEIAIYNNLIQRTKRRCITIYIYIFIEINPLDLLRNELLDCWKSVGVTFLFQRIRLFFLFSNDLYHFFLISQHSFLVRYRCTRSHFIFFRSERIRSRFIFLWFWIVLFHGRRASPFVSVLRQMVRCGNCETQKERKCLAW